MATKISIVIGIVLWQRHLFKNLEGDPFATRKVRQKLLLGGIAAAGRIVRRIEKA
jgi:hypothetical protein